MNTKKFWLWVLIAAFVIFGFTYQNKLEHPKQEITDPIGVSLIQLIANPEKYDNKIVRLIGYLNLEFEGDAIYLHEEDNKHSITANSCWVNLTKEWRAKNKVADFSNKYVILVGTFDMKDHGHMGMFSGGIRNITRLDVWNF